MATKIIKASGQTEEFHIQKLINSLIRSGASEDVALTIAKKVEGQISPFSNTKHIFRLAKRLLRQYNTASGMRYSIKKAIYSLGPSGYPFEKYFARILNANGYTVETNRFLEGYCVTHEVDVFASKGNERSVIECKYHINGGTPTDVKEALYIYSRFADIKKASELLPHQNAIIYQGWLVTNTRCTSDAIKYAECVGLKIVSWRYPEKNSLEKMIEDKMLYPVTILPATKKDSIETLFSKDIILAQDIAEMDGQTFIKKSGLDESTARILKKQADELCTYL
jgi:hypothetical protein